MSAQDRMASYGRGGAGNLAREEAATVAASDLSTPTLKAEHYTTGRGGSGNMVKNDLDRPEIARASQDVDGPAHREVPGPQRYGRGGAANVTTLNDEQAHKSEVKDQRPGDVPSGEKGNSGKDLMSKGREMMAKISGSKP